MKCKKGYEIQVLHCGMGYYIGTFSEEGPYCRISAQYWKKKENAEKALAAMNFKDRAYAMEVQFCNGGRGCLCNVKKKNV